MDVVAAVGADEESAAVVQPGEGAFDDPAVSAEAGAVFDLAASDDRLDSAFPDEPAVLVVVVAAVGDSARGLRRGRPTRPRTCGTRSSSSSSWVTSLRLPPVTVQAVGCHRRLRAGGACCRRDRGRPGSDPFWRPLFRLQMAGVGDRALPFQLVERVQLGEQQLVQPLPHSGLLPGAKPPPSGHAAAKAELLRQMLPADPGVQHEQDPLLHLPVVERLAARIAETPLPHRQQRLDPLP